MNDNFIYYKNQFIIYLYMKSYGTSLKNQSQLVIKQSIQRRKQIQQLISCINKRIDIEQTYAKNLQNIGKNVDKFIYQKTISSLTFSAFQLNNFNRALQSKALCKSLKEQVLTNLKNMINSQNTDFKNLEKQIKKIEKQGMNKFESLIKSRDKCLNYEKEHQQMLLQYQIAQSFGNLSTDKKTKLNNKSKQIYQQIKNYEENYLKCQNQYDSFKIKFNSDIQKLLGQLQQHQINRIQRQLDTIMKILIFQTSMIKNFQYDINNISSQITGKDPKTDILYFVNSRQSDQQKFPQIHYQLHKRDLLKQSLYQIINNKFYQQINYNKNKQVRKFIQMSFKQNQSIIEFSGINKVNIPDYNYLIIFIKNCWQGKDIDQKLQKFKQLVKIDKMRLFCLMSFQQYLLFNNIIMKKQGVNKCVIFLTQILSQCIVKKDVYVARKLISLTFHYYIHCNCKQQLNSQVILVERCNHKIYLSKYLKNFAFLKYEDFWQASILQYIIQQLHTSINKIQQQQQLEMKERSIILGQLASFCHNVVMFGLPIKTARDIIGRFCRLYQIPQNLNRDLSRSIAIASKKYKQMFPEQSNDEQLKRSNSS